MDNRDRFWHGVLVGAGVTLLAGMIIVCIGAGAVTLWRSSTILSNIGNNVKTQVTDQTEETKENIEKAQNDQPDWDQIQKKMQFLQQVVNKYYLFDEDAGDVEEGIYAGLMSGLNDPYSVYYTEEEYKSLIESTSGVYCGIGAMVTQNVNTGVTSIVKVFEGTPSAEAGMLAGDIIYKVDDTEVTGMDLDLIVGTYIKGEENTPVEVTVLRGDTNEEIVLKMKRRKIEVPTISHQMLANHVGYIAVSQFDDNTDEQFAKAIDELEADGMEKLVIDLRDNPGGVLDTVVHMLDYMLPDDAAIENDMLGLKAGKGLLVYTADKYGNGDKYRCKDKHEVDIPTAVLVNGNSASASEVFSGAMKDYKRAKIVGTQTFGKGIVQNIVPLGDGTAIKLTTAHYYTPTGFDLHGTGIEPDIEVELSEELKSQLIIGLDQDNQLNEAIKSLE